MRKLVPPVAGTLLTVAFELSLGKGWFEATPDTLVALLWFFPVLLWVWWLYTHEEVKQRRHLVYARPMISLALFVIVGGVLGSSAGALGWWSLKRQHLRQLPLIPDKEISKEPAEGKPVTPEAVKPEPKHGGNHRTAPERKPEEQAATVQESIHNISVETRLTCELKDGAEIPPSEVPFMPVGDGSDAALRGAAGQIPLQFVSPVRFRRQGTNQIVVINQFALPNASDLYGRPIGSLRNFKEFKGPVVTIVYANNFSKATLYELSVAINGRDTWYYSYSLSSAFPTGGESFLFTIPLEDLHKRLAGE